MISAYTQSLVIYLNQRYQFDPKTFIYKRYTHQRMNILHRHKMIIFSQEYIVTLEHKKNALECEREKFGNGEVKKG